MSDFHIVVIFNDYYTLMVAFLTKQTFSQHSSPSSWLLLIYHSAFFIINKQTNNIHSEVNRRDERLRKSIFETDL